MSLRDEMVSKALTGYRRGFTPGEMVDDLMPLVERELAALRAGAARDVLAERRRQVEAEGWTPEHDDEHDDDELAKAAACYALGSRKGWPWYGHWWKPSADRRRNLVKAAALLLAEIERLDRAAIVAAQEAQG